MLQKSPNSGFIQHHFKKAGAGFTLIEVLLAAALLAVLSGIMVVSLLPLKNRTDLDDVAATIAQSLYRAQLLSQATDTDTGWGVKVLDTSVTIFIGNSYDTRNNSFDDTFNFPSTLTRSGLNEVAFSKFAGLPNTTGSIVLSLGTESRTININPYGKVEY